MRRVIQLRREPLPLVERLILPLDGIAASFFISLSVGLLRVGGAPGLERLAEKQPAPRAKRRGQRTALAKSLAQQSPARRADSIADDPGGAYTRATAKQRAGNE